VQPRYEILVLSAGLALSLPAAANTPPELSYTAPPGCPNEAEFRDLLSERGAELKAAGSVRALDVRIEQRGESWLGTLEVRHDAGQSAPREVTDASCREVARGLSVVAALALGAPKPEPSSTVPSSAVASEPPSEAPPAAPVAAIPAAPAEKQQSKRTVELRGSSFDLPPEETVTAGTLEFRRFSTYTLAGGARYGIVPGVLPQYSFTISSAPFLITPAGRTRLVGPIVQVRWSFLGPARLDERGYETDLWGLLATPAICSGIAYGNSGLSTALCGEFEVGALQAKMKGSDGSRDTNVALATAGLGLDAQYHLGSVFHLGLRAGASVQIRSAPTAPDGKALYEPALFGGYVELGLGLHF
jgi:hypothetical protein